MEEGWSVCVPAHARPECHEEVRGVTGESSHVQMCPGAYLWSSLSVFRPRGPLSLGKRYRVMEGFGFREQYSLNGSEGLAGWFGEEAWGWGQEHCRVWRPVRRRLRASRC